MKSNIVKVRKLTDKKEAGGMHNVAVKAVASPGRSDPLVPGQKEVSEKALLSVSESISKCKNIIVCTFSASK